jgi:hypothetical protein
MNKDILGLNVSMNKMRIIKYSISFGKLFNKSPNNFLRAVMMMLNIPLKRSTVAILHNEIEVMLGGYLNFQTIHEVIIMRYLPQ